MKSSLYCYDNNCRHTRANRNGELPARFMRIGRYWDRINEIDICGVPDGEGPYLWGECRWSARKMDAGDLRALEEKVVHAAILYYSRYLVRFIP